MLLRGDKLSHTQRKQVLSAFVHRWTHENAKQSYGGKCPGCAQHTGSEAVNGIPWHDYHAPLVSDEEWIKAHAFHFTKDGSRLMANKNFAEPAYLADPEEAE